MKSALRLLLASCLASQCLTSFAATSIDPSNRFAYGANIGWINARGDVANGAVIGEYVCSGYLYAANVGWISLGSGSPVNGVHYQNNSGTDFGVNHDGLGNLRGYAYGANIGWINFENIGHPTVDLKTGNLQGYAWSANCGWISLSNTTAFVQTDFIAPGVDSDGDGMTDAWELTHTNTLAAFGPGTDTDGDGVTDQQEYVADTDPLNPGDYLRITSITRNTPSPNWTVLVWTSQPTRCYVVQDRPVLDQLNPWMDYLSLPMPGANTAGFFFNTDQHFFRIRAFRPLSP